uniref:hypothetical protein n=1 Tax=Sphingomonas populi TaxID=2484750 RepID=UPI0019D06FD5|nr:hypothetical protein [Sphingomonas populi]
MLVGPPAGHAAHHCQRILGCRAPVLTSLGLANTKFRVPAASPMICEHDLTHLIVDVHDDIGDQRAQQAILDRATPTCLDDDVAYTFIQFRRLARSGTKKETRTAAAADHTGRAAGYPQPLR